MKRQIEANNALDEANVKGALKAARQELDEKFHGRLAMVEKSIEELKQARER